jgi:glutamine amidotransferase
LLGICLGMQWLFEGSDEATDCPGLGVLAGRCRRLSGVDSRGQSLKVPHVGWNSLNLQRDGAIVAGVAPESQVYFTHSFMAPITEDTVAVTAHGEPFAAIVERGCISGVQFHPEKSGDVGLAILRNFLQTAHARP